MSKTKGFLLTAGLVLATAFTFSCSSGGGGDKNYGGEGACYGTVPGIPQAKACLIGNNFTLNAVLCETNENIRRMIVEPVIMEACPSDPILTCPLQSGSRSSTAYFYGNLPAGFTCETVNDD